MRAMPTPPTKEQREANNRVRDYLRAQREKNPDLTMADGQARAEKKFPEHVFPRTSFKQTYWDKSEPELPEYEEFDTNDDDSLLWIEPREDGDARLCVNLIDTQERVFAACAALTAALAGPRDDIEPANEEV